MRFQAEQRRHRLRGAHLRVFLADATTLFVGQLGLRAISCLLCRCSPSAVFWAIWAVVVYSIQSCAVRFRKHICNKISYIVPTFAHCDPTPSVPMRFGVVWVVAAIHHGVPCRIQRMIPQSVLSIFVRRFCNTFKRVFYGIGIAMAVPPQIMFPTQVAGQRHRAALWDRASFHLQSLARAGTFVKPRA